MGQTTKASDWDFHLSKNCGGFVRGVRILASSRCLPLISITANSAPSILFQHADPARLHGFQMPRVLSTGKGLHLFLAHRQWAGVASLLERCTSLNPCTSMHLIYVFVMIREHKK